MSASIETSARVRSDCQATKPRFLSRFLKKSRRVTLERIIRLAQVTNAAVLVPVKAFSQAKLRLEGTLSASERRQLARGMASHVLRAAAPLPVAVVCDDPEVAKWAEAAGAEVVWCPGAGLNGAVSRGVSVLAKQGLAEVVVAHGDLPGASRFDHLTGAGGVTAVPDRHGDGTNVLCVPADSEFGFSYGAGSFHRHCKEALRLGLPLRISHDPNLSWDVDLPEDLQSLPSHLRRPAVAGAGSTS